MSAIERSPLHGVGGVRLARRLRQEAAAEAWFRRNPEETSKLCALATGVPKGLAQRVRTAMGLPPVGARGLPVGCP